MIWLLLTPLVCAIIWSDRRATLAGLFGGAAVAVLLGVFLPTVEASRQRCYVVQMHRNDIGNHVVFYNRGDGVIAKEVFSFEQNVRLIEGNGAYLTIIKRRHVYGWSILMGLWIPLDAYLFEIPWAEKDEWLR